MKLQFLQVFGSEQPELQKNEITVLRFSDNYLAVGQSDGSVFVFNYKSHSEAPICKNGVQHPSTVMKVISCFNPFEKECDLLYGMNIRPDIVDIHFIRQNDRLALVANQRNVQIFGITENSSRYAAAEAKNSFPLRVKDQEFSRIVRRECFKNVSSNEINAVATYDDFFSVFDEFEVSRFNFDRQGAISLFNFVPTSLEQKYETITHGEQEVQSVLSFSTSDGAIYRLDDRCNLARQGAQQLFSSNKCIHSYKLEDHKYYMRHHDSVEIYDDRNCSKLAEHVLDPHSRRSVDLTRFCIDVRNKCWATGEYGELVEMGFDISENVYQFEPKFKLKRTKNSDFAGVGGLQIVENGEIQYGNFRDGAGVANARAVAFSENELAIGCGGNLFLYGWIDE